MWLLVLLIVGLEDLEACLNLELVETSGYFLTIPFVFRPLHFKPLVYFRSQHSPRLAALVSLF